ncbi:MAG: arylsulfatase [Marinilabiliaceae bacterium]
MPGDTRTIAHELKDAGYTNACIGKWGLGHPGSKSTPLKMGFDYFFGYNCQRHAHHYFVDYLWENDQRVEYDEPVYSHDIQTEKAFNFIRENQDDPFFLYLAYTIPHAEMVLPDEYLEPFIGRYPEPNPFPGGHYGAQEHPRAALAAMISHLDSDVGRLMDLLEKLGIDENTLVIFTSDNGPHMEGGNDPDFFNSNGPFRGYKRDLYEGGIRVPFIAHWPRVIEEGRVSDHVSAFWDMYPTFCEVAGIESQKETDGISLLPELKGEIQTAHNYLYWEFPALGGRQAVRMGKWKGVRYNLDKGNREIELYNLETDPDETEEISDQHPEVTEEIRDLMRTSRDPSSLFEFPLDEE